MKKWTPKMKAKAAATRAANRAKRGQGDGASQDALAYLLKAEKAIIKGCARGAKSITGAETLTLLALNVLRGEL